jgi:hypothetical protein
MNTPVPGGQGNFSTFSPGAEVMLNPQPLPPRVAGKQVVFWGEDAAGNQGLYASRGIGPLPGPGPVEKIVDVNTPIPGGMGNFVSFTALAVRTPSADFAPAPGSASPVAFIGTGSGGQEGIYVSSPVGPHNPGDPLFPTNPIKVIDLNDTLDGKTISNLQLGPGGLSGDPLVFAATFTDGTQGIYLAPVVMDVVITSINRVGADLKITYTAPVGYNYSVQSCTDLARGEWTTVSGPNPGNDSTVQTTVPSPFATAPMQFFRIQQSQSQ